MMGGTMAAIHSVEISWEALLDAFTNEQSDKQYYLDRLNGDIFFVPYSSNDSEVKEHLENSSERFLEIPLFDYRSERQIISQFVAQIAEVELKNLLNNLLAGRKPFGKIEDILSFYPHEEENYTFIKDEFLSNRLKNWMEENNLITSNSLHQGMKQF